MPGATDYTATYTATNLLNYITGQLAGRRTPQTPAGSKKDRPPRFRRASIALETTPPLHVARVMVYGIHL
ncbi:MAG: hypothetical protein USCAAHI_01163 [Beijerinckiaceae bacterium]|jgi:hypothetical protein|nr:MAG: hypothetical protein USCAAHI_01163 [Beijerinckiaceae bacterium]